MDIVMLQGGREDASVYASGRAPDGSPYLAVAADWEELHACVRASARAEGWAGWCIATGFTVVQ